MAKTSTQKRPIPPPSTPPPEKKTKPSESMAAASPETDGNTVASTTKDIVHAKEDILVPPFTISCTKIDGFRPGSKSYLDYDLCERMRELMLREIVNTSTYAIDMVKFPLGWGTADDSAEYVYKGTVPLKIWFCGEVQLNYLVTPNGDPKSNAALRINTLWESDQLKLEEILFDMCHPKVNRESRNGVPAEIWAGKFMSKKNTPTAQINLFKELYDARERLVGKERPTYSVHALKRGDVVMVESYIQRYRPPTKSNATTTDDDKGKKKWEPRPWVEWKVKLQLKKLYVLHVGDDSGDAPGDVSDEGEDI